MIGYERSDIPDQTGKVAVVTGGNSGLGFETCLALAERGATVILTARDEAKASDAAARIRSRAPGAPLESAILDLASLESVRRASAEITDRYSSVDMLINNAGVMATPERRTEDGFELQFGVNHLGHWTLTARLMPAILRAVEARVVTVTSTAHYFGRSVDPSNPNMEDAYDPWLAYGRSKLANYYFGLGLQREFERAGVGARSLLAHPGLAHTNLQVRAVEQGGSGPMGRFWRMLAARTGMTSARGALSQLRAATDPRAEGGTMYAPLFVNFGPPVRHPLIRRFGLDDAIDNLWRISERLTGERLIVE